MAGVRVQTLPGLMQAWHSVLDKSVIRPRLAELKMMYALYQSEQPTSCLCVRGGGWLRSRPIADLGVGRTF